MRDRACVGKRWRCRASSGQGGSRSAHWDRLRFPLGPPQIRLELETKNDHAGRFISDFDRELREIFNGHLSDAEYGKAKELCVRLYPELFGAQAA